MFNERNIDECQVHTLTPERRTWMTPIVEYLQHGVLHDSREEARKVITKEPLYIIIEEVLYKKVS